MLKSQQINKIIFLIFFFFCQMLGFSVSGQNLYKRKLYNHEKKNNVFKVYEYRGSGHFVIINLCLYKDKTFKYSIISFNQNLFSKGIWFQNGDTLVLANNIKNGQLPIKLHYTNDSSATLNGFQVGVVKNLLGQEMSDGLVAINSDFNICLPSYGGICREEFSSVDSIKIIFENGLESRWLKNEMKEYKYIIPVVQINFLLSQSMVYDFRKFAIRESSLEPIN